MKTADVQLSEEDRRLLEDNRRLMQQNAALMRGVLASLPKPVPPGDWGRSSAPAEPLRGHVAGAASSPARPGPDVSIEVQPPPLHLVRPRQGIGGVKAQIDWPDPERMQKLYDKHRGNVSKIAEVLGLRYQSVYHRYTVTLGIHEPRRRGRG